MNENPIRSVELQLLRHGPPHNQLLSPLTDYLALCGDHSNTTVNFPMEHQSLVVRLNALRYVDSEQTRTVQLQDTAAIVGSILAQVPGLISELGHRDHRNERLVHASIATSASELSMVPFELATSPSGFPGSGDYLSLQTEFPVCITRRSRQVRCSDLSWNVRPRILMISSDAGGAVPVKQHYTLLRKLLDPWIRRQPSEDENAELQRVREHLVLLHNLPVREILKEIRNSIEEKRPYTHVHVLAHGCEFSNHESGYGIKLGRRGDDDVVNGRRLGQLLTARDTDEISNAIDEVRTRPRCVSLAVCDSGAQQETVWQPGSSIAFHVHEVGIPLVVGSMFPLSQGGSVVMTNRLYEGLLSGADPRRCVWEMRRDLFHQYAQPDGEHSKGRHDWASVVVFAALPNSIDEDSQQLTADQNCERMDAVLDYADKIVDEHHKQSTSSDDKKLIRLFESIWDRLNEEVDQFDALINDNPSRANQIAALGISASANKRTAEVLWFHQRYMRPISAKEDEEYLQINHKRFSPIISRIRGSYRRYLMICQLDANQKWAFVQALSLKRFLSFVENREAEHPQEAEGLDRVAPDLMEDWARAKYACLMEPVIEKKRRVYDLCNNIELGLLLNLLPEKLRENCDSRLIESHSHENILGFVDEFNTLAELATNSTAFSIMAGRRQLLRYHWLANAFCNPTLLSTYHREPHNNLRDPIDYEAGYSWLQQHYGSFTTLFEEMEKRLRIAG